MKKLLRSITTADFVQGGSVKNASISHSRVARTEGKSDGIRIAVTSAS